MPATGRDEIMGETAISTYAPRREGSGSSHAPLVARILGAILLLGVGADHLYEYTAQHYSAIPTIGTLFLLNIISATVLGVLLLIPLQRLLPRRGNEAFLAVTLGGLAIAATSLAALLVSEQTTLFGFMEANYRPEIIVAIALEAGATLCLGTLFVLTLKATRPAPDRVAARLRSATPSAASR
jgi:hypothetical protein